MKFVTIFTKTTLSIALILGMNSENSTANNGKATCPTEFIAPDDLDSPLSAAKRAEKSECMPAYSPMNRNVGYTESFYNTYCSHSKGVAYGYTYTAKHPNAVDQKECKRIGEFMVCYLDIRDNGGKNKKKLCPGRLENVSVPQGKSDSSSDTASESSN